MTLPLVTSVEEAPSVYLERILTSFSEGDEGFPCSGAEVTAQIDLLIPLVEETIACIRLKAAELASDLSAETRVELLQGAEEGCAEIERCLPILTQARQHFGVPDRLYYLSLDQQEALGFTVDIGTIETIKPQIDKIFADLRAQYLITSE